MKRFKKITTLTLILTIMLGSAMSVNAAPKTMPDGQKFDAEYYANSNPDVVAALGTSETALYNHYVSYGKAEGRKPYANAQETVDVNYGTTYKDLGNGQYLQGPLEYEILTPGGELWDTDIIAMAKDVAPTGTEWGMETFYDLRGYKKGNNVPKRGQSCQAFAYWLTDAIFGTTPAYLINSDDENGNIVIKQYDIIIYGTHCVVALNVNPQNMTITAAEGGFNGTVNWGRTIKISDMISAGNFGIIRREGM